MPVIHINIRNFLSVDDKRTIAKKVTDVFEDTLGIGDRTEIFFHDIPDENFAKGGTLLIDEEKS